MHRIIVLAIALCALNFAASVAAAPLGMGEFTGASGHETSGSVTVTKQDGRYVISFAGNFSLDGAPDPYVSLGKGNKPLAGGLIAILKSHKGAQSYAVDTGKILDGSNQVIIWCKKYAVPLGVAAIK
ncbi:MAG: DM13 domain-containing protein [Alphaproteobacteria bacterium]|nr:DM13 domain-containing protein [Alphaproteobacteria bacterium]